MLAHASGSNLLVDARHAMATELAGKIPTDHTEKHILSLFGVPDDRSIIGSSSPSFQVSDDASC